MQGMSKDQPRPATGDDPEKPKDKDLVRVVTLGQEQAAQHLRGLVTAFQTELAIDPYDNWTRSNPNDPRPLGGMCYNLQAPLAVVRLDCEWSIVNTAYEGGKKVWTDNEDCFVRLESRLEETKAQNEAKWVACRDGRVAIRNAIAVLDDRMATQDVRVPRDMVANWMDFAVL